MLARESLLELLTCHATPGDEASVRALLERAWRKAGWRVARLGDYAVTATPPSSATPRAARRRPTLLVTAHMDAPGYAVDRLSLPSRPGRRSGCRATPGWGLTRLGGAQFAGPRTPGLLKCAAGCLPVTLLARGTAKAGPEDVVCRPAPGFPASARATVRHGDRVCFAAQPSLADSRIDAPFLDNRLGCWLLAELPRLAATWRDRCRLVLGATSAEEMGGWGASVLATHVRPDLVVVLDATYVAPAQGVKLGGGPVLTLSDASVLLSPARRDAVAACFAGAGVPLQTEVYNFSGTDARAFPRQGLTCPVLPLLLPTTGNHTPRESADLRDADALAQGLRALAETDLARV